MVVRALAVLAVALFAAAPLHGQQVDVIRGRVIGPDSLPIERVTVTATSMSGSVSRQARTDRNGRFTITFPGGEGDYMMSFSALGYAVKRFEVKRTLDDEVLIADAKLSPVAALLDQVNVLAPRDRVARSEPAPDIGGSERPIETANVPIDQMGDLAAMAASLPGVQLIPGMDGGSDGFSVLGLGADQNNTTLNGMNFGGSNVPRDAGVRSSLATSPYDVSRGGFSGAQFSLSTRPGSNYVTRGSSLNIDAPQLQWSDRAAQSLGQEYANVSLGGTVSGPITMDKAFYNLAYQLGRRANDYQSLFNTDAAGLQAAGVSADSAARLRGILQGQGIPVVTGDVGSQRLSDQGSLFGSFDFAPPTSNTGQAINLSFNGNWSRQTPAGGFPTEVPAFGGDRTSWRGGLQGRHSSYLRNTVLSETSFGVNGSRTYSTPYLSLPTGRVRVSSGFDDGTSSVQSLAFGGNAGLDATQTSSMTGVLNQLSWFSRGNTHRLKLTSELRHEGFGQRQSVNTLGTFNYQSLADLAANAPSSFTRQLSSRRREGDQLVAGFSLGDAWRRTRNLQLQYGVRVDGNRFLTAPDVNPLVAAQFGVRNDEMPNGWYVSPRAGFSWTYGTAAQVAGFEGAMRGPRASVRGGVGVFQNTPSTAIIGTALDQTGLASGAQQVSCVGDATPVPEWDEYATNPARIPTACADGTTTSPFGFSAPNVSLFAKDYRAPRALRSNLQWSGPVLDNALSATVDATYSRNMAQPGMVDLNFDPTTRFTLGGEGGRPVFVDPAEIVAGTGAIAAGASRVSPVFARVNEMRSDLRSESRQISLRIAPMTFSQTFSWSLSYVYANVRERVRGFNGGNTAGNPLQVEWARSTFDSRHQVMYTLGYNFFDAVRVSWFGQFRSGTPYTPMIAGDVNGDGYVNDRAFVFDPDAAPDAATAAAMRALVADGSKAARECLGAQLGRLAARNSCQGPWTSQATLSISFNPVKLRMPRRASLSFQLSNPLGAADLLVNGSNGLRGWGQNASPDQSLLYVRGFDAAAQRFTYEVNQRFGATSPSRSAIRTPVTLTALMRFDVGPTRERQALTQQLDRGRRRAGTKVPEPLLKAMYGAGSFPNPMTTILRQQDTLGLTGAQADSIAALNRTYTVRIDSIWTPVARYLGALPDSYDPGDAYRRYLRARQASVDLLASIAPAIKSVLTPEQRRRLPQFVAAYLEPRYLASIRSGTPTFIGGMQPVGGGMAMPGAMMSSGAVNQTIIVR